MEKEEFLDSQIIPIRWTSLTNEDIRKNLHPKIGKLESNIILMTAISVAAIKYRYIDFASKFGKIVNKSINKLADYYLEYAFASEEDEICLYGYRAVALKPEIEVQKRLILYEQPFIIKTPEIISKATDIKILERDEETMKCLEIALVHFKKGLEESSNSRLDYFESKIQKRN